MDLMGIIKEAVAKQGFTVNWVEEKREVSNRQDNRGLQSTTVVTNTWRLKIEIEGADSWNQNRHRVVNGSGASMEQALANVLAEVTFIKTGSKTNGS